MARMEANQVILDYDFEGSAGGSVKVIDIAYGLSLLNRKSYRSGYVYSVDYVEYIGAEDDIVQTVVMPFSYPLLNAWRLGFDEWKKQRARAIDETGIEPGKWSDFKPWYSVQHYEGPSGGAGWEEITPSGITGNTLAFAPLSTAGSEWNRAELIATVASSAQAQTINVGMLGLDDMSVAYGSLINVYGETRVATLAPDPLLPTAASTSWITRVGPEPADMQEDVINLIEAENDYPPYANEEDVTSPPIYNGGAFSADNGFLMDKGRVGSTGRPLTLNGGVVPLGLMILRIVSTSGADGLFRVHCTRGNYKGVAAVPMGDFR